MWMGILGSLYHLLALFVAAAVVVVAVFLNGKNTNGRGWTAPVPVEYCSPADLRPLIGDGNGPPWLGIRKAIGARRNRNLEKNSWIIG